MKNYIAFSLCFFLMSCSTISSLPSVSVSIEDMEGVGNEHIPECQIFLDSPSPSNNPCVIELLVEWDVNSTTL